MSGRSKKVPMRRAVKVITLNDDFTDRTTDTAAVFRAHQPTAMLTQESKREDLRKILPDWLGVAQVTHSPATAGVAVIWHKDRAKAIGPARHRVLCLPRGAAMEARGITWQRVRLANGNVCVLASTHRPPPRYSHLWPEFDAALDQWVITRRAPVILGMDANTRRRAELATRLGMRQAGSGVDAVFVTHPFKIQPSLLLPQRRSDHRAFEATVLLP